WACDFEPESNELVAIAGSDMVLFLNVQQARYVKKYTHVEPREEFKCLAWTSLKGPQELLDVDASEDSTCTILAVAGRLGSIKLVNVLQNQCFRHLFGHEKQIRKLQFSKTYKRWLLSASDDMSVRLWDVGAPNNKQENTFMCLAKFVIPPSASMPTALSAYGGDVIVGCAEGQLIKYKIGKMIGDGDAGVIKHKELYPSGDEWHEGYVDDVFILGQQEKGHRHPLDGCIVSRGSADYETLIWKPKSSTKKDADIAISLEWPESAEQEGLRFKVVEKDGHKVLVAGDYDGQIQIYNFGDGRLSRTLEDNSKEVLPATKVLSHPMSSKLIRDIAISEDSRTIVAVDSANNVFIWQCT
ncbi:WD40-repeat-containing domain protein, partial [Dichotomocladium elegans]